MLRERIDTYEFPTRHAAEDFGDAFAGQASLATMVQDYRVVEIMGTAEELATLAPLAKRHGGRRVQS
jgi:hypothetical protein